MLTLLTCIAAMGLFWAGAYFAAHTLGAVVLLSICAIVMGLLFAHAETRGWEGQTVRYHQGGCIWQDVVTTVNQFYESRYDVPQSIWIQLPTGPARVRSVYFCRINHEMSIVLDSTEDVADHAAFNAAKQGVRY